MISKSFLRSSVAFTAGGALPMVASIVLLPFYTNVLSQVHYTQVMFYISLSLLFQIFFSFCIETYFGIRYTQLSGEPGTQRQFTGTASTLLLLIGVGLLALTALAGGATFDRLFREELGMHFWPYGFYSVLTAFFNSYFKAASIALIYFKKVRVFLVISLVNFFATIGITVAGIYLFPGTIVGPIYGRLLSGVIIFIAALVIFRRHGDGKLHRRFLPEMVAFCAPYLLFVISGWVLGQVDRYVLQSHIDIAHLNSYDLLMKCFFGIEFLQNSLSAVIYPRLYEIRHRNQAHTTTPESNRYFNVFTAINILQLIAFCICIPLLFRLIVTKRDFYASEVYIGVVAAGFALRSILNFYLSTVLFTKKLAPLLKIFGLSALVQVVLTFWWVRQFGLTGAILAGLVTRVVQTVLCGPFTRDVFRYEFNRFKIVVLPAIYIAWNVAQFILFPAYNIWLYLLQLVIFGAVLTAIFRNEILRVMMSYGLLRSASR